MADYPDSATDTWLVARVAQQDDVALMKLYSRHGGLVYGTALRVLRSPGMAEEVTQDVFLRVWRRPERWNAALGAFPAWLTTITRNAAIDRLRKEQRRAPLAHEELEDLLNQVNVPNTATDNAWFDAQIVQRLLQELPDSQRVLVELAFYWGYTHTELAEQLDLPLGTVKTRLRAGLLKLRSLWEQEQEAQAR